MRALIEFGKANRLRFISHLDLQRTMQTVLRRTNLPVAYSQGFNPHPLISFASALAVGHTSEGEILDVRLREEVAAARVFDEMHSALPEDLPIRNAVISLENSPSMSAILCAADYEITLSGLDTAVIDEKIRAFLARTEVLAMRKTKSGEAISDIRPMAISLSLHEEKNRPTLNARLSLTEKATLRPELLVRVLTEELLTGAVERVHRLALLTNVHGEYVPLLKGFS